MLNCEEENPLLLKCSLYKDFKDIIKILKICNDRDIEFKLEYFYFDLSFLENNIDYVYLSLDGMKKMGIEMSYDKAMSLMQSKGFVSQKKENKPRRVA